MFLIRRAKIEDVPTLYKLARMVHFINLPADKDLINEKVLRSRQSFMSLTRGENNAAGKPARGAPANGKRALAGNPGMNDGSASAAQQADLFMFALEDAESGGVLGTSQLLSAMGAPGAPNVALRLSRKEMFSQSLQQGMTHITAQIELDETGPTEIGGLILQPSYRGHKEKLGRFLSHVRFHFIALNRARFSDRILAEMMGAITHQGEGGGNTLWEYLGRRFINLTYLEADRFCQHSKEFITALMPREEIYLTLLPPEARGVIAQVGPETLPARRMLEKLGFAYRDRIDPFDGGPHLEARTDDLEPVRATFTAPLGAAASEEDGRERGLVSATASEGEVRACSGVCAMAAVCIPAAARKALDCGADAMLGVTPYESTRSTAGAKQTGRRAPKEKPAAKATNGGKRR